MLFYLLALAAPQAIAGAKIVTIPGSANEAFTIGFSGPRFARHDPSPIVSAALAEDGSCVWIRTGSYFMRDKPFGWHRLSLPDGKLRGSELIRFQYNPGTKRVSVYTLSQSAAVEPILQRAMDEVALNQRSKWRLTRDDSGIIATLDAQRVLSVTSENPRDAVTMVAAGIINMDQRGTDPNRASGIGKAVSMRDRSLGASLRGSKLLFAEASATRAHGYSYDFAANMLTETPLNIPYAYRGRPVIPRLYDFHRRQVFYDFALPGDPKKRIWTEYDGTLKKWRRYSMPHGEPGPVFLSRGLLWANTWDSAGRPQLYRAAPDRKTWEHVGPYAVVAHSLSGRYWVLFSVARKTLSLADLGK